MRLSPPVDPRSRVVRFASDEEKARYLDAAASEDATSRYVREHAARFARQVDPNDRGELVRCLFRFWRDSIHYVRDGRIEELADTKTILLRGYDDCDGKSRGFVAECRALAIDARILPRTRDGSFAHVQAWVSWPRSPRGPGSLPYPKNRQGGVLAEFIVQGVELGDDAPAGAAQQLTSTARRA
jgi:hypothetical protein